MQIENNEYGALKLDLYPDKKFFGQSHYRYLFGLMQNGNINQIDSIDIKNSNNISVTAYRNGTYL